MTELISDSPGDISSGDITSADLLRARRQHLREIRLIRRMSDAQFEAFKGNFSLGLMDPELTRDQALELLQQMLMTNVSLQCH